MTLFPDFMSDLYRQDANAMVDELGVDCKLIYPPVKGEQCNNCITMSSGGSMQNHYRNGGPMPFSVGGCPLCGGKGFRTVESPDKTIKLRINYEPSTWLKLAIPIQVPDGSIQVIGKISDLPDIKKCNQIIINNPTRGYVEETYALHGEPIPHGMKTKDFFIVILGRT